MKQPIAIALIGAAAVMTAASPAAASVTTSSTAFGLNDVPAGSTLIDFDHSLPAGFTLSGGQVRNFSDGAGAEPAIAQDVKETSFYLTSNPGNPATLLSSIGYRTVSFLWGSIDDYNTVYLLNSAGATIQAFTGMDMGPPANGDQGAAATNRRVTFTTSGATSAIYGLRFETGSPAFEVDNVAFSNAVPEPASWAMMICGFGAIGAVLRRRAARNDAAALA